MKLIQLTSLLPKKNEKMEVIGWVGKKILVNPDHIQDLEDKETIPYLVMTLASGKSYIVEERLKDIEKCLS